MSKDDKKRIYKTILITISSVGLLFIGLLSYDVYWTFFDMNRLPKGEYLTEESSTAGTQINVLNTIPDIGAIKEKI